MARRWLGYRYRRYVNLAPNDRFDRRQTEARADLQTGRSLLASHPGRWCACGLAACPPAPRKIPMAHKAPGAASVGPAAKAAALKGRIHGCTRTLRADVRFLLQRGRRPYMALLGPRDVRLESRNGPRSGQSIRSLTRLLSLTMTNLERWNPASVQISPQSL